MKILVKILLSLLCTVTYLVASDSSSAQTTTRSLNVQMAPESSSSNNASTTASTPTASNPPAASSAAASVTTDTDSDLWNDSDMPTPRSRSSTIMSGAEPVAITDTQESAPTTRGRGSQILARPPAQPPVKPKHMSSASMAVTVEPKKQSEMKHQATRSVGGMSTRAQPISDIDDRDLVAPWIDQRKIPQRTPRVSMSPRATGYGRLYKVFLKELKNWNYEGAKKVFDELKKMLNPDEIKNLPVAEIKLVLGVPETDTLDTFVKALKYALIHLKKQIEYDAKEVPELKKQFFALYNNLLEYLKAFKSLITQSERPRPVDVVARAFDCFKAWKLLKSLLAKTQVSKIALDKMMVEFKFDFKQMVKRVDKVDIQLRIFIKNKVRKEDYERAVKMVNDRLSHAYTFIHKGHFISAIREFKAALLDYLLLKQAFELSANREEYWEEYMNENGDKNWDKERKAKEKAEFEKKFAKVDEVRNVVKDDPKFLETIQNQFVQNFYTFSTKVSDSRNEGILDAQKAAEFEKEIEAIRAYL